MTTPSSAFATGRFGGRMRLSGTALLAGAVGVLIAIPLLAVGGSMLQPTSAAWDHIVSTTLAGLVGESLGLVSMTAVGVALIGVAAAWVTARYEFPLRRAWEWLLVLPLAMPAYVMAYAYTDFLQYAGPLQTWLREVGGFQSPRDYWFPDVRSLGGAAVMLSLALYPYVYLLARVAFLEQPASLVEAGRGLGYSRWRLFWRVSLPLARPAIAAGVALALMEALADYGTVSYFGVRTFTTGIFSAWFAQGDRVAAAKLSTLLVCFVALLLFIEYRARRQARFAEASQRPAPLPRTSLGGAGTAVALLVCAVPLTLGFLLPLALLVRLIAADWPAVAMFISTGRFVGLAGNSLLLAGLASLAAVALALAMLYAQRRHPHPWMRLSTRLASLGYAMPGTVIAVGALIPLTRLDHALADFLTSAWGRPVGLLVTGSIAALVYAYLVRFLSVALQSLEAGFAAITPSMDDAARSMGAGGRELVVRVHLPLLRASLLTAALMVFVEVMKELPATLVMRPFNFDTLAVQAYVFAKDERLAEASVVAIAIVLVGLIPVVVVSRAITAAAGGRRLKAVDGRG